MPRFASSTAVRLAAFFSVAFTLAAAALGISIYWAMRIELQQALELRVLAERQSLLRQAANPGADLALTVTNRSAHGGEDMRFALYAGSRLVAGTPVDRTPSAGWSDVAFQEEDKGFDLARTYSSRLPDGTLLLVGADPESVERMDENMVPIFAIAFGVMAVIGVSGGFLLSSMLRRRIEAIGDTARAIIGGELHQRIPTNGSADEFDRLSATLNAMLDRIAALLDSLRQVSSDIAHDMRTPIGRLRQTIELALAGGDDPAKLREALHHSLEQSDEMLELFNALLTISEVEASASNIAQPPVNLSALTDALAESYAPAAEDTGRSIVRNIASGIHIDGNRELIAQLVVNLLDNALRHTPEGASIAIVLRSRAKGAELVVADDGDGILPGDRERVFQRFTRLESSRSTPGHGLGLNLVAAVASAHGATVRIEDNQPGARFIITFPEARS